MDVLLRAPELSDVDMMYRLENDPLVAQVSWGQGPVSRQMLWNYVHDYCADPLSDHQMRFIIEADGEAVGCLDISDIDALNKRGFVGIGLEEAYRGKGVASEALRQSVAYSHDILGLHQLVAIVPRRNVASMRLFEGVGFRTAGCLRSWMRLGSTYEDAIILQLLFP